MYKLVFYYAGVNRAGSEIALLRYLKQLKSTKGMLLAYGDRSTDLSMLDEFKKYIEVKKIDVNSNIEADVAVNGMISRFTSDIFNAIKAKKKIFWVQMNPKKHGNYMDFERYDCYLTTSEYVRSIILESDKAKGKSICVAQPIVDAKEIRSLAIEKLDLKPNSICTIARVCPEKGYDYYIEIAKRLKKKNIDFKWYMIGFTSEEQDSYDEKLRKIIKENDLVNNIIFVGVVKNPYMYLKNSKINILLSKDEAWGLAVNEARILEVPSIASNNSALKEQIKNGVDGYLVDLPESDSDYEMIVNKIIELLNNESLYESMVKELKKYKDNTQEIVKKMSEFFNI